MVRLFCSLVVAFVVVIPARADEPARKVDEVRRYLDQQVARKNIAGAVYLVSKKGKVILEGATGMQDTQTSTPMATSSIFRIASMTKPITSVAIMMLVEEGKLKLDDPLAKYIPEFADPVVAVSRKEDGKVIWSTEKAKQAITIRQLLNHTSGISYRFINRPYLGERFVKLGVIDGLVESDETVADNVKKIARVPLIFQPGSGWEYGLNTDILGRVVEIVSGQSLDEFFRDRLFTPLKMTDTYFLLPKEKRARLAAVYEPAADGGIRRVGTRPVVRGTLVYTSTYSIADKNRYQSGGGGLVSTARDYHRFLSMMLKQGELEGKRILKVETVKQMTSNQIGVLDNPIRALGNRFGFGFGIVTKKGEQMPVGTYSWGGLFATFFWVDPTNEVSAVLLTQLFPSDHLKLREEFVQRVYKVVKE